MAATNGRAMVVSKLNTWRDPLEVAILLSAGWLAAGAFAASAGTFI